MTLDQLAGHCQNDLTEKFTYFHARDRARLTLKLIEVARAAKAIEWDLWGPHDEDHDSAETTAPMQKALLDALAALETDA